MVLVAAGLLLQSLQTAQHKPAASDAESNTSALLAGCQTFGMLGARSIRPADILPCCRRHVAALQYTAQKGTTPLDKAQLFSRACRRRAELQPCSSHALQRSMSHELQYQSASVCSFVGCSPVCSESSRCQLPTVSRQACYLPEPTQHEPGEACKGNMQNKGLFIQAVKLRCKVFRQSRHSHVVEAFSIATSCFPPASAGSHGEPHSLRTGIKQMESDEQLRTAHKLLTKHQSAE